MNADWTIDELAARASAALSVADYPGPPNGRVREMPDRRLIRWYATIGLLDKPAAMRGRTALYGPRHLLQLVAIKRRQAQGRSLAEIQAELVGASDAMLRGVAAVPHEMLAGAVDGSGRTGYAADRTRALDADATRAPRPARFWAASPARTARQVAASPDTVVLPAMQAGTAQAPGELAGASDASGEPADDLTSQAAPTEPLLAGLRLGGGVVLLLPRAPGPADVSTLRHAARPLLDLLAARGLLAPDTQGA
jgi:MerR HTH family regulatory protein